MNRLTALVFVALTMGCASRQVAELAPGDRKWPRKISCGGTTVIPGSTNYTSVELRYEVTTEGNVTGIRRVSSRENQYASDAVISAATAMAQHCIYEPATRNGYPVVATVTGMFFVHGR